QLDAVGRRQRDQRLGPRLLEAQHEVPQDVQDRDRHGEPPQGGEAVGWPRISLAGWHGRVRPRGIGSGFGILGSRSQIQDSEFQIQDSKKYEYYINFSITKLETSLGLSDL